MLYIKDFSDYKVVFSDGKQDYTLTADPSKGQCFIRDIIEDILNWCNEPSEGN